MDSVFLKVKEAKDWLKNHPAFLSPSLGLVLGSGLGSLVKSLSSSRSISYQDIPHFQIPQVEGHSGKLFFGFFKGVPLIVLQGRFHFYEGYSLSEVTFPVRVLCSLGIQFLILTNAAGGLRTSFRPGDLMLIEDHLNLMGQHPLRGPRFSAETDRFLDMTVPYDLRGRTILKQKAKELQINLQTGVYAAVSGPSYETPAEVRMLQILGADAVGMSTVPEVLVAHEQHTPALGISCISNLGAGLGLPQNPLHHQDVLSLAERSTETLKRLIEESAPLLCSTSIFV